MNNQEFSIDAPSNALEVRNSLLANAGRGVFAKQSFAKGDLIEKCPATVLPLKVVDIPNNPLLHFTWFE